ncbi:hypothetical protein [Micromonospora sp. RV43]|uniref:hypothetical protein n=1 Tax=Micromonospora sp. RV43 TaxID=1661387 RepID=UPI00064C47B6|nr:hypothetical protein [Micromonospora sp. RV43]
MSVLYFTSPSAESTLAGPERHWLGTLAAGPAMAAWNLNVGVDSIAQCAKILAMIPEVPDGEHGANYLHRNLREAQADRARFDEQAKHWRPGTPMAFRYDTTSLLRLVDGLRFRLGTVSSHETTFHVAGENVNAGNVLLNTALAAGADPIRLAAKLYGWHHIVIPGEHRAWVADIIDAGLSGAGYRSGMRWDDIAAMLRANDTEPVVTSHSTGNAFPSAYLAGMYPSMPDGVDEDDWAAYDQLPEEVRRAREAAVTAADEAWEKLDGWEQFWKALTGLLDRRPWCQLTPDTLAGVMFGPAITAYDLLAQDRDERVRAAIERNASR